METAGVVWTDAGMCGLWNSMSFRGIVDYDTWEEALLEDQDIARQITAGAFVPVNVGGDGAFRVVARVGSSSAPAELTHRERQCVLVSSEPYLLVTTGVALISGIEHVGAAVDVGLILPLPAGRWVVRVDLIEWEAEPGGRDETAQPTSTALPDFVLLINPEPDPCPRYRTKVQTFDRRTGEDDRTESHAQNTQPADRS